MNNNTTTVEHKQFVFSIQFIVKLDRRNVGYQIGKKNVRWLYILLSLDILPDCGFVYKVTESNRKGGLHQFFDLIYFTY